MTNDVSRSRFWIVVGILVVSIASLRVLPFTSPWGLDLQNLWAFHHCPEGNQPYLVPGHVCHDVMDRQQVYPPLLYWAFAWTRLCSMEVAAWIWDIAIVAAMLASAWLWIRRLGARERFRAAVIWLLLMVQFPAVFAIERGNNDALVLLLWSIIAWLYSEDRPLLAGVLCGVATALKIYPGLATLVVAPGVAVAYLAERRWRRVVHFALGGIAGLVLSALATFNLTRIFVGQVLPAITKYRAILVYFSHPVPALLPEHTLLLEASMLLLWMAASARAMRTNPFIVWAGALAISTYFASTSFDYNLITCFPLLAGLWLRAERSMTAFALLAVGLLAIVGDRTAFQYSAPAHLWLQVGWLDAVAIVLIAGKLPGAVESNPGSPPLRLA